MASNADSGNVKGHLILGICSIISALIGVAGTVAVASGTGHLITPSDTREFQKAKQENARLLQENEGLKEEGAGLRQEIEGLKRLNSNLPESDTAQSPALPTSQQQDPSAANRTETVDNFVSQLDGCKKNRNGAVTCMMKVTNTKPDRVVRLYGDWTSIIDSAGNQQKAKLARIGASTAPTPWMFAETTLPTNVAVKVTVGFEGVDADINRLSILTIGMQSLVSNGMPEKEEFQFRGVPLN